MAKTWDEGIKELRDRIGSGKLVGRVEVDQVYARYQHEDLSLRHPRGGGAKYLSRPLFEHKDEYLERIARDVLRGRAVDAMRINMNDLSKQVRHTAPVEFGDLRKSGHPSVKDHGKVAYDRPPEVHRLTEEEIKAKRMGRRG